MTIQINLIIWSSVFGDDDNIVMSHMMTLALASRKVDKMNLVSVTVVNNVTSLTLELLSEQFN